MAYERWNCSSELNPRCQERLKLPGAWWTPANVEAMLALRLARANREYDGYWRGIEKRAA